MSRALLSALRNVFATDEHGDDVHFHIGAAGVPAVCEFPHCDRPALSVE